MKLRSIFGYNPKRNGVKFVVGLVFLAVCFGLGPLMGAVPKPTPGLSAIEVLYLVIALPFGIVGALLIASGPLHPENGAYWLSSGMPEETRRELFPERYED